jgi:hypothetical protein
MAHPRFALVGALTLMAGRVAPAQTEDVARVLERQTQELLNAVTAGDMRVWDRYLDAQVITTRREARLSGSPTRRAAPARD